MTQPDQRLLDAIKRALPELRELLESASDRWSYEDGLYRFYHQSFKVYALQQTTERIVKALQQLQPERNLNARFLAIVEAGTGKVFALEHNARWDAETRPIVEAFLHAKYFLEMAVRYAERLDDAPQVMPSGWAAVLYLFEQR